MFRKLTLTMMIGVLALSLVATGPAAARDRSDNGNLIAGLAIGAIVGAVIASNTKSRRDNQSGYVSQGSFDDPYLPGWRNDRGYDRVGGNRYEYARPASLPAVCRVYAGNRSGYSGRCLSRKYRSYNALPSACAVRVGGQHRTIYREKCLNEYGYY